MCEIYVDFLVQFGYPVLISICQGSSHFARLSSHLLRFVVAANSSSSQCECRRDLRCRFDVCEIYVEFLVQFGYPYLVSICQGPSHFARLSSHLLRFVVAANSSSSQCECQRGLRCLYDVCIKFLLGFRFNLDILILSAFARLLTIARVSSIHSVSLWSP